MKSPALVFDPVVPAGYTMYVDPSSPASTDTNNPNGSPAKPRKSIPNPIPAGTVVELHGTTQIGTAKGTLNVLGTAAQPVFVKGVGATVAGQIGAVVTLAGGYVVWTGTVWDKVAVILTAHHVVLDGCEIRGHSPAGNSAALSAVGQVQVIRKNHIHHNGDSESVKEVDIHGIKVTTPATGVWILGNEIDHNGGDAIQIGEASLPEPWPQGVFIEGNVLHEDRENAVDVKKSRDVVVIGNTMYGYKERNSSAGEAFVVHNGAQRVWVMQNLIATSVRGISYTGVSTFLAMGNLFLGVVHNPQNTYDPTSLYGSYAISGRDSDNVHIDNNTIYACDGGISFQSGLSKVWAANNAVNATHQALAGTSGSPVLETNVLDAVLADFVNPAVLDFSPVGRLVHTGTPVYNYQAYQYLYGTTVDTDMFGHPVNPPASIGAVEAH